MAGPGELVEVEAGPQAEVGAVEAHGGPSQHEDSRLAARSSGVSSSLGPVAGSPDSIRRRYAVSSRVLTDRTPRT